VATADHGLHLGDFNVWSKQTLFDASLRVPLVFRGPGVPVGVYREPVETAQVAASLVFLAGLPPLPRAAGPLPGLGADAGPLVARSLYERDLVAFESDRHAACRGRGWPEELRRACKGWIGGRSLRSRHWRFTEWSCDSKPLAAQLYLYESKALDLDLSFSAEARNRANATESSVLQRWRHRLRRVFPVGLVPPDAVVTKVS